MKIVAYDGVSKTVIGLAVALYRKAKRAGRRKVIKYGYDTIIATPKKVMVLLRPPIVIIKDNDELAQYGDPAAPAGVIETMVGSAETTAPAGYDEVTGVGAQAIFSGFRFSTSAPSAIDVHTHMHALQILWDNKRFEQMYEYFAAVVGIEYRLWLSGNGENITEFTTLSVNYSQVFFGSDADGELVALCYAGNTVYDDLNVAGFANFPTDTTTATKTVHYDGDEFGECGHYKHNYIAVKVEDLIRSYITHDGYTTRVDDVSNSANQPDVIVEYTVNGGAYTATITQAQLQAEVSLSGPWTIDVDLGVAGPASYTLEYRLVGTGGAHEEGVTLVSGASLYINVDSVDLPDSYTHIYIPERTSIPDWHFYESQPAFSVATTEYFVDVKGINTSNYDEQHHYLWNTAVVSGDHIQLGTAIVDMFRTYSETSGSKNSVSGGTSDNHYAHVAYIAGEIVATTPNPPAITDTSSALFTYLNRSSPTRLDVSESAVFTHAAAEGFMYDGAPYIYDGPFAPTQNLSHQLSASYSAPTWTTTQSMSGYGQNRALRSWWHEAYDAAYGKPTIQSRLFIKRKGFFDTVHIYSVGSSGDYKQTLYVNGDLLDSNILDYAPILAVSASSFRHGMPSKITDIHPHVVYAYSADGEASGGFTSYSSAGFFFSQGVCDLTDSVGSTGYYRLIYDSERADTHPTRSGLATSYDPVTYASHGYGFYGLTVDTVDFPATAPDPIVQSGYIKTLTGKSGDNPHSGHGYALFPLIYGSPGAYTVIHWKGATADTDGICIVRHANIDNYLVLFSAYLSSGGAEALDGSIEVIYNNFASIEFIRYFAPGSHYAIHTTPPE